MSTLSSHRQLCLRLKIMHGFTSPPLPSLYLSFKKHFLPLRLSLDLSSKFMLLQLLFVYLWCTTPLIFLFYFVFILCDVFCLCLSCNQPLQLCFLTVIVNWKILEKSYPTTLSESAVAKIKSKSMLSSFSWTSQRKFRKKQENVLNHLGMLIAHFFFIK